MASSTPKSPFTATLSPRGQDDATPPMRRRNSMGNIQELDAKNISVNFGQQSKSLNLTDLIQATLTAPGFAEVVGPSLVKGFQPVLNTIIDKAIQPLIDRLNGQSKAIEHLNSELKQKNQHVSEMENKISAPELQIQQMEHEHDNPGQYSRRNILRFHNVPLNGKPQSDTDQVIIKLCREKLGLPNLTADNIMFIMFIKQHIQKTKSPSGQSKNTVFTT
ncbi:hypothetical protein DPMN_160814 [Dreissena polymorpha]|uniref:Uncharacterized protein n=1 Tax=Dreissena polymorpha TaxID=45954 RepID=A0A9D4EMA0_DREPO|nr:hypothetical protein DPMN_160814 [Dreissena polymorpha]